MVGKQMQREQSEIVYLAMLGKGNHEQDIKLKLGLAELIFHALILVLLV